MTDSIKVFKMAYREMTVMQKDGGSVQDVVPRNAFVKALNPRTRAEHGGFFIIGYSGIEYFIPESNISNAHIRPISDITLQRFFPETKTDENKKPEGKRNEAADVAKKPDTSKSKPSSK